MLRNLQSRELGKQREFTNFVEERTISRLSLSKHHDFVPFHSCNINCCDLDPVELRYLLSGGEDGSIGIHDLNYNSTFPGTQFKLISSFCASINSTTSIPDSKSISTLQWYPHDSGMFLSSGEDRLLKIWDTNAMSVATEFKFRSPINSHQMSPSNLLVAVCNQEQVQIVDLKSGSYIQKLNGSHGDDVMDVCWSPRNNNQLISAGKDGEIIMWDIRRLRSSCFKFKRKDPLKTNTLNDAITTISPLPNYLHLLSFSHDNALRMWDMLSGKEMVIGCESILNSSPTKMTIATTCTHAFVPCHKHIYVVDLFKGKTKKVLKGHLERVTCVVHRQDLHHLISTSTDRNILYWSVDEVPDKVDTLTNLTDAELNERKSGEDGNANKEIDYFSYNAEEYYKDERKDAVTEGTTVSGGDVACGLSLVEDNWSDDD